MKSSSAIESPFRQSPQSANDLVRRVRLITRLPPLAYHQRESNSRPRWTRRVGRGRSTTSRFRIVDSIVVGDAGRDGRATGSLHERSMRSARIGRGRHRRSSRIPQWSHFEDVALYDIDPHDVSFRIRSPHGAEASLHMTRFLCVRGHISSKKARRRAADSGSTGDRWLLGVVPLVAGLGHLYRGSERLKTVYQPTLARHARCSEHGSVSGDLPPSCSSSH